MISLLMTHEQFTEVPLMPTREQLLEAHTNDYLDGLTKARNVAWYTEMPFVAVFPNCLVRSRILEPMLYATSGSLIGARLALDHGWAINVGGGYHHACGNQGGGFCIYADITLMIRHMRKWRAGLKVLIVDLDAHQGNGHARDAVGDSDTCILDMFNASIYPQDSYARKRIDVCLPLEPGTSDVQYLAILQDAYPATLDRVKPDVVIYNAGTDCLSGDPLGQLDVSEQGIIQRDEIVFREAMARNIPIVMLLSGGYQRSNAEVIAKSIDNLRTSLGLFDKLARQAAHV
eukprot:TRINITY_DN1660_c0_g1_i1.p1 TRINITY_DN1660_c0_g1~~TRINITY_DN1660_c0_g1_i1.p1  ORF type:complete len:288 (+),score=44.67 TRINITY_DN1660_c0_g1_i1:236-1099(+)